MPFSCLSQLGCPLPNPHTQNMKIIVSVSSFLIFTHLSLLSTFAIILGTVFFMKSQYLYNSQCFSSIFLLPYLISLISSQTSGSGKADLFFLLLFPALLFLNPFYFLNLFSLKIPVFLPEPIFH